MIPLFLFLILSASFCTRTTRGKSSRIPLPAIFVFACLCSSYTSLFRKVPNLPGTFFVKFNLQSFGAMRLLVATSDVCLCEAARGRGDADRIGGRAHVHRRMHRGSGDTGGGACFCWRFQEANGAGLESNFTFPDACGGKDTAGSTLLQVVSIDNKSAILSIRHRNSAKAQAPPGCSWLFVLLTR